MSLSGFLKKSPYWLKDRWTHTVNNIDDQIGQPEVTGKVIVITGSNGGLGRVVSLQMAKRGARVVMACRDVLKAEKAMKEIREAVPDADLTTIKLDLSDLDSVHSCAKGIIEAFPCVNVLINNAGIFQPASSIQRNSSGFEKHLVTNYLGHVLLTMLLLDHLKRGVPSRIVTVSSMLYAGAVLDPEDLNWQNNRKTGFLNSGPYDNSKKLQILFGRKLSQELENSGVNVYCLCPGLIWTTDLYANESFLSWLPRLIVQTGYKFLGCTPEQGARAVMYCALAGRCANETGQMYHYGRLWESANHELDEEEEIARRTWNTTENLLGVSFEKYLRNS